MKVNALDHVNIVTRDLAASARFYAELFGLERSDLPPPLTPEQVQWLCDASGRTIVHLNSEDCPRAYARDFTAGATGAIHHVALNCSGFDELIARLDAHGIERQVTTIEAIGLRQVFTHDPDGVLLELNFFGD